MVLLEQLTSHGIYDEMSDDTIRFFVLRRAVRNVSQPFTQLAKLDVRGVCLCYSDALHAFNHLFQRHEAGLQNLLFIRFHDIQQRPHLL